MSFKHEFYLLDSPTPFIAGFDFIVRAGLVIDSINRLVWSKGVVLTETLNQSFLTSNQHAKNNDRIELQSNGERMNADNDNCGSLNNNTSKRRSKMNGSTASVRTVVENNSSATSDVPEHLRVLFLTTPFRPKSDGQTERANRTILQMLRASICDNPEDWPSRIPALLAA